jgi:hypothetical protein
MTAPARTTAGCPECTHHVAVQHGKIAPHYKDGGPCSGAGYPVSQPRPVVWHPNAVATAVRRLAAITTRDGFNPDDVYRLAGVPLLGQDLMVLVDVGRTFLEDGA